MAVRQPTSVLLPTTRWTDACSEVAAQLRDGDELLVIHDGDGDPVARRTDCPTGVRRWTALLAYPAVFGFVPLVPYSLARRTFVWGGRRYRWPSKFDVEIVG